MTGGKLVQMKNVWMAVVREDGGRHLFLHFVHGGKKSGTLRGEKRYFNPRKVPLFLPKTGGFLSAPV